jgi:hypothetical protein
MIFTPTVRAPYTRWSLRHWGKSGEVGEAKPPASLGLLVHILLNLEPQGAGLTTDAVQDWAD